MKTSNKLLISILGIISLLTLLYFLTPIRYLFYKSPPSQTTTNAENPNWADSESPSLIQKSEIEIYNSLIRDSYITISKYYQIAKPSELKAEIISKSIEFVKQLENIEDRNLNFAQSIEKYYIIGNLLLCAADLETKNEQKIFLSDLSIKSIAIAMNFIQESKNSDPLAYQWALEENMEDRLLFYTTLNLCIKKIAGETIDKKEILEPLNSILKEKRDKYNLDNHRLILGALDELKQINDINKQTKLKKEIQMSNATIETSQAIKVRYAEEATTSCCLSCGIAIEHAKPEKGEVLIDLGSGRGLDVLKAARIVETAYGIDFTKEMIKASESSKKKLKLENAHFLEGKIDQIPLPDNTANIVISNCTINHAPNKNTVYKEIYRVLKPGGRFVVSDIIAEEKLPDHVTNDPKAWAACYGGAIPESEYFEAIYNGGFKELEVIEKSEPYQKVEVVVRSITIKGYKK